jgi:hypothetical protein
MMGEAQRSDVNIHVFADRSIRRVLLRREAEFKALGFGVDIVQPDASIFNAPRSDGDIIESNPWLFWMERTLKRHAVDYMHFICHGQLGMESGNLRFAAPIESRDQRWAEAVGPRGIEKFLTAIAAWSVSFGSPSNNPSPAGLRLFTHLLARHRSGPVVLHDMKRDPTGTDLRAAMRFFTAPNSPYPGSPFVSIFANPNKAAYRDLDVHPFAGFNDLELAPLMRVQRTLEARLNDAYLNPNSERRKATVRIVKLAAGSFAETRKSLKKSSRKKAKKAIRTVVKAQKRKSAKAIKLKASIKARRPKKSPRKRRS